MSPLAEIREAPGLDGYLGDLEERLELAVGAYRGVVAEVGAEALAAGGKRLRPLLVYLSTPPGAPPPVVAPVGKGKAPIGKGKGKAPPPPVITKG